MFGFEHIRGFPLDYTEWHAILNSLLMKPWVSFEDANKHIQAYLTNIRTWDAEDGALQSSGYYELESFLKESLFVKRDQVVVPTLNLKSAKKIFCRNEKQKKALRKMGFIEDRIMIHNFRVERI
jgi:hypothetical protein